MPHDIRPADIRQARQRWLDEALDQIPDDLIDSTGISHRKVVDDYLRPLLKRCNAKSRRTFWNFLRLSLAKDECMSMYLMWCRESKCRPETVTPKDGPRYVVNGDVALLEIIDAEKEAVWRIPLNRLSWALDQFPIHLKPLPEIESPVAKEIRLLERKLVRDGWRLTSEHKADILRRIGDLELERLREFKPEPRYMLTRYDNGREILVHRDFVEAGPDDIVEPIDSDLLNFTTAKVTVTVSASSDNGLLVRKGDCPFTETQEFIVPNLRVINSATGQARFEKSLLQQQENADGEPLEIPLVVKPNESWVDAGRFRPLSRADIDANGRGNVELPTDQPEDVSHLCREQSPLAKEWESRYWRTIPSVAKK